MHLRKRSVWKMSFCFCVCITKLSRCSEKSKPSWNFAKSTSYSIRTSFEYSMEYFLKLNVFAFSSFKNKTVGGACFREIYHFVIEKKKIFFVSSVELCRNSVIDQCQWINHSSKLNSFKSLHIEFFFLLQKLSRDTNLYSSMPWWKNKSNKKLLLQFTPSTRALQIMFTSHHLSSALLCFPIYRGL